MKRFLVTSLNKKILLVAVSILFSGFPSPAAHTPSIQFNKARYLLAQHPSSTGFVACRTPGIDGFEEVAARAVGRLPNDITRVPSETVVFITVAKDSLYLHSNFVTRGFPYPTKINTTRTDADLMTLSLNLIGVERESGISLEQFLASFPQMHFIVEGALFRDEKFRDFDFSGAPHVEVIGEDGVARKSEELSLPGGNHKRIVEYYDNIYASAQDANAASSFRRLGGDHFDKQAIRFMSLVLNRATEQSISKLSSQIVLDAGDRSFEAVKRTLSGQSGNYIFVLGHVERDTFVVRNPRGQEVSRIPIAELLAAGSANNVRIFPVGCNSAAATQVGVATTFNTVDAVNRLASALQATDWLEFYRELSSPDLKLVLDSSMLMGDGRAELMFDIRDNKPGVSEQVGSVRHYLSATSCCVASPGRERQSTHDAKDYRVVWVIVFTACIVLVAILFIKRTNG